MRVFLLVGVAAATALASQLPSAQQQPTQPTFRTGVDVVQVDVSVLDKDRKPIRGLTTADFNDPGRREAPADCRVCSRRS